VVSRIHSTWKRKAGFLTGLLTITTMVLVHRQVIGQAAENFSGEKTSWHGFDRFDFQMDETTFTVTPIKAVADEGTGVNRQVQGQVRCVVVVPNEAAPGKPWSWRGRYFDHEPQAEIALLKGGFHIGFIHSDDMKHWDAWYQFLTEKAGLSQRPAFVGMSGGGRNAFTWATTYPDRVSCIYADNPLITRESLMKLGELVQRDVPLLHICGSLDPLSGNHTLPIESIYQHLGGRISVMIKDGVGHHPHSLRDPTLIADFITRSLEPAAPAPAFVGKQFIRSSFYSVANSYTKFPKEELYITCRGAYFSETYDRYEFKADGTTGTVNVIVPKVAAAGTPWVLRADLVSRDAVVDLALLQKGFHIVTGPRPRDPAVTVQDEWNGLYRFLIDQGFNTKPVMECAGGAAGEVYAWAIANPDKVSCIYGENPVLRHHTSKTQPLDDLAPLAKANVPLLHVCGSLDPWLESQTRVVQQRYRDLGGQITVLINEGQGHYPLAPQNQKTVVDFLIKTVAVGGRK
jgi:pimeloyl-ACP methyl ester carboxylesterase